MTATEHASEIAQIAAQAASDKKANDIVALDVSESFGWTDVTLVCSGTTERSVIAIANAIEDALLENGVKVRHREGKSEGRWILLDFGDLVAHVMHEEERMYYSLERLWSDAPVLELVLD